MKAPNESALIRAVESWSSTAPISGILRLDRILTGGVAVTWGGFVRGARKGTPDFLGYVRWGTRSSRIVAIECKAEGGRLTKDQIAYLSDVVYAGGVAIEGRTIDQIEREFLNAIKMERDPFSGVLVESDTGLAVPT